MDSHLIIRRVEATWGADPLETMGGFRAMEYDDLAHFPSSITANGTVSWSRLRSTGAVVAQSGTTATFTVSFPEVDWYFLQSIYGWAALQFQAWTRGSLTVNSNHSLSFLLYTENVLEFWLDGKSYFGGDVYSYRRAPLVLKLRPGPHRLDVRLVRDVRIMGGSGKPFIQAKIEAVLSNEVLTAVHERYIFPDILDGRLASSLGSVPVRNAGPEWVYIHRVIPGDVSIIRSGQAGGC